MVRHGLRVISITSLVFLCANASSAQELDDLLGVLNKEKPPAPQAPAQPSTPPAATGGGIDIGKPLDALKSIGVGGDSVGGVAGVGALSVGEIASGLKEALQVGTGRTVSTVGVLDGFNANPEIHIPLPGTLRKVQSALEPLGMSDLADDLELKLNRAAEAAAPEARALFVDAISAMTLDDVMGIYEGPQDAATRYFQDKMTPDLTEKMRPIVMDTMAEAGAVKAYDDMMAPYQALPLMPDVKADVTDYTVGKALEGLFHILAKEEAAIRQNPTARTTALLQKVFG